MSRQTRNATACAVLLGCLAATAWGGVRRDDVDDQFHIDLGNVSPFDSVGMVEAGTWLGSGTLLNIRSGYVVLTSAHLLDTGVAGAPELVDPADVTVTLGGVAYSAAGVAFHPDWDGNFGTTGGSPDLGLIALDTYVDTSVSRANLLPSTWSFSDLQDALVTTVGYGEAGTGDTEGDANRTYTGDRRAGHNVIDHLVSNVGYETFMVDFDNPGNTDDSSYGNNLPLPEAPDNPGGGPFPTFPGGYAPGPATNSWQEYLIYSGDSGGGNFVLNGNSWVLAGVSSFLSTGTGTAEDADIDSDYGDLSGHVNLTEFRDWIVNTIANESGEDGQLPAPIFVDPTGDDPPYPWFQGTINGVMSGWGGSLNVPIGSLDAGYGSTNSSVVLAVEPAGFNIEEAFYHLEDNPFGDWSKQLYYQPDDSGGVLYAFLEGLSNPTLSDVDVQAQILSMQASTGETTSITVDAGVLSILSFDDGRVLYHIVDPETGETIYLDFQEAGEEFRYGLTMNEASELTLWAGMTNPATPLALPFVDLGLGTLPGDMNGDGEITNADINPFVMALTDPAAYAAAFPDLDLDVMGDLNADGLLTNADINLFVEALVGDLGATPAALLELDPTSVPEPATLTLLGLGGLAVLRRRRNRR